MAETTLNMEVTLYGYPDNDPAGTSIAYPTLHSQAGGTGTFQDPVTFASAPGEFAIGQKIYVPYLQKYFIMEDYCAQSVVDWKGGDWHVDLWAGGTANSDVKALLAVENGNTRASAQVIVDPAPTYTVNATPLFGDGQTSAPAAAPTPSNNAGTGAPQTTAGSPAHTPPATDTGSQPAASSDAPTPAASAAGATSTPAQTASNDTAPTATGAPDPTSSANDGQGWFHGGRQGGFTAGSHHHARDWTAGHYGASDTALPAAADPVDPSAAVAVLAQAQSPAGHGHWHDWHSVG